VSDKKQWETLVTCLAPPKELIELLMGGGVHKKKLCVDLVLDPLGRKDYFVYLDAPPTVGTLVMDRDKNVALTHERPYLLRYMSGLNYGLSNDSTFRYLNLPGGCVEKDEEPLEAAVRELREETQINLDVSQVKLLGKYPVAGKSNEITSVCYIYFAQIADFPQISPQREEGIIEIVKIPFEQCWRMVGKGEIFHASVIAAIARVKYLFDNGQL
jgi:ADP-ribose pyrophosphatase YjhB (NUDIX family)